MAPLKQLIEELKSDRKKLGVVVGLVAVGMLMWGRLLLKQVPKTASATDGNQAVAASDAVDASAKRMRQTITLTQPAQMDRDLFLLDPSRYSRTPNHSDEEFSEKLPGLTSDGALQMAVVQAAVELELQSVTQGDVPAAFINGRLIRVGQSIEGFVLLECDERTAVLERGGIKVRIKM